MIKKRRDFSPEQKRRRRILINFGLLFGLILFTFVYVFTKNWITSGVVFVGVFILVQLFARFNKQLKASERIHKMEDIFPDFLQLMSSNLRAGMTIDRAMLLSARKEFAPLDLEIEKTAKDIATGKDIALSLKEMAKRIKSEKIEKIILLIISGIKAGGDIATLLDETSVSMRERGFVQKRAASNVMMYVIFIFLAVSIFAPALFSLSTVLVEVLTTLLEGIPDVQASAQVPFTLSSISISTTFIKWFALVFILATDFLASMVLGLVSKGEEKQGLKYFIPISIISIVVFFTIRILLGGFVSGLFG